MNGATFQGCTGLLERFNGKALTAKHDSSAVLTSTNLTLPDLGANIPVHGIRLA